MIQQQLRAIDLRDNIPDRTATVTVNIVPVVTLSISNIATAINEGDTAVFSVTSNANPRGGLRINYTTADITTQGSTNDFISEATITTTEFTTIHQNQ